MSLVSNELFYKEFKALMKEKEVAKNIVDNAIKQMRGLSKFAFFSF